MDIDQQQLSFDRIKDRYWRYFHAGGRASTEFFKFLPGGAIGGYSHQNECYWQIENGLLSLLNNERKITVTFDSVEFNDGKILLTGKYLGKSPVLCLQERSGRIQDNQTKSHLANEIANLGWSVGDHTYGLPQFFEKKMAKLVIGKYCSIADGVKIAFGNHRTDTFTTFPFRAKGRFWEHVPPGVQDHVSKGDVVIGNDVWIGTDVFIGSGITIGSGAVLGAKSVITKDVPPYAIVVGNPGRVLRYRFDPLMIEELLRLSWWDLSDELVDSLLPVLMSNDAPAFLSALKQAKSANEDPSEIDPGNLPKP